MSLIAKNDNTLQLEFSGSLDIHTVARLWDESLKQQEEKKPQQLIIEAAHLNYCDGAGIALILELKKRQHERNQEFKINNLNSKLESLLNSIVEPHKEEISKIAKRGMAINVGAFMVKMLDNMRTNIIFIGKLTYQFFYVCCHPKVIRWHDVWLAMEDVGPNALGIIALIGFLVGLISGFQSSIPLERFGAQIYIINLVGLGLFREMGPLMTAVLLAGRTASSFAAELGTMKVNQEIDALTTMGLDSIRFLTIPRMLAAMVMTPFLSIFMIFFGLLGCGIVMHDLGYNLSIFMHQLESAIKLSDIFSGLIKTFVFGFVIAAVGCLHGLKTRMGAAAVGHATTQAVVTSIIMLVFVDGIFALLYYVLGI